MHRTSAFALAALTAALAAFPAAAIAQTPERTPTTAEPMRKGEMHGRRSFGATEMLLRRRAELKLTDDQVARLEAIRTKYEAQNRPHIETMQKARAELRPRRDSLRDSVRTMTREQRRELREKRSTEARTYREQHPEVRKAMEALRESREAARQETMTVLTPEQRTMVEERMHRRRGEMKRHRDSTRSRGDRSN